MASTTPYIPTPLLQRAERQFASLEHALLRDKSLEAASNCVYELRKTLYRLGILDDK
jgi:hypothetical protein